MEFTRAEVCITAASDSWRDAGEVLAHAVGTVPMIAPASLAGPTPPTSCCPTARRSS
ncbi:hypothetical protein [Actinomadura sp. CNU-125]|uniref:hypothetical protein n=1 Tax=Actinomadura sp. CNU-125 TaxID=1904961 RepID=UPI002915F374|nr:hypothetical protein [Actinomadura sp. CNU-125]